MQTLEVTFKISGHSACFTNETFFRAQKSLRVIAITNDAAWSIKFQTSRDYFDTRKKSLETRS